MHSIHTAIIWDIKIAQKFWSEGLNGRENFGRSKHRCVGKRELSLKKCGMRVDLFI